MAKTTDLLDSLGVAEDGISTVYPETFVGDIRGAYAEDAELASAAIQIKDAEIAALTAENLALKAHNYELMVSVPATSDEAETEEDEEPSDEDSDENSGVDSLFKNKDES